MSFQNQVLTNPAPGVVGGIASMNPMATVKAGPGGLTAGASGVYVGRFVWNTYATAGGPGRAQNSCNVSASLAPRKPDGFIGNRQQALITTWLGDATLVVPAGTMVTEHVRGDFWVQSQLSEAVIGNKVFANVVSGQVLAAAAGTTPTLVAGASGSVTGAMASATNYSLNITAVASGTVVEVGMLVTGANIPVGTYIESFGTFNGSTGTVFLSQNAMAVFTAATVTVAAPEAYGYFSGTATFATTKMTVATVTSGLVAPGQIITSASVTTGTYVISQDSGTPGGVGVYSLSTTPGTITPAQAITATSWVETDWYVKSAGNVMDLIAIGVN